MDLTLIRRQKGADGFFSDLHDDKGNPFLVTADHAYLDENGKYVSKTPAGRFWCVRGTHALHDGVRFETFEIMGLPDFQGNPVHGILFHRGNFPQKESEGCHLTGKQLGYRDDQKSRMVMDSKKALEALMLAQLGVQGFWLTVIDDLKSAY